MKKDYRKSEEKHNQLMETIKKELAEQREKETKAIKKFESKNNYEKSYFIIYDDYAEMYSISIQGRIQGMFILKGEDFKRIDMNQILKMYNKIE